VVKGEPAVYHVISRTALDGFVKKFQYSPIQYYHNKLN
jgi:hypothetical protein